MTFFCQYLRNDVRYREYNAKIDKHMKEMSIVFMPLTTGHFSLLHAWLNKPHVAQWYLGGKNVTYDQVYQKYRTYVDHYTIVEGIKKAIRGYIITIDKHPIGYIQYYYAHDFENDSDLLADTLLPLDLAAIDIFIGDIQYIGKGFGPLIITSFLQEHIWNRCDACLVDPDTVNVRAINAYKKAGFQSLKSNEKTTWMVAQKPSHYVPTKKCTSSCCCKG